jgi:hypothetical protein
MRPSKAVSAGEVCHHGRFFSSLFARLTQWFADAANGIESIVARVFKGERGEFQELCVDDVCVTRDQFAEVFGSSQSAAAAGAPRVVGGNEGAPAGPSATTRDADTATTTTSSDNETAADASSVGTEAPSGSSASTFGIDANTSTSSTPTETEPSADDAHTGDVEPSSVDDTGDEQTQAQEHESSPEPQPDEASATTEQSSAPQSAGESETTPGAAGVPAASNDNTPLTAVPATGTE